MDQKKLQPDRTATAKNWTNQLQFELILKLPVACCPNQAPTLNQFFPQCCCGLRLRLQHDDVGVACLNNGDNDNDGNNDDDNNGNDDDDNNGNNNDDNNGNNDDGNDGRRPPPPHPGL